MTDNWTKEQRNSYQRKWHIENLEKDRAIQKKSRERHREKNKIAVRVWRAAHPNRAKETYEKYKITGRYAYGKLLERKDRYEISISREDFMNWFQQAPQVCCYCGRPVKSERMGLTCRSIDRKDNKKGYSLGNLVIACVRCNIVKGSWLSHEQMLEIAKKYLWEEIIKEV